MKRCDKCRKDFPASFDFCVYCGTALVNVANNEKKVANNEKPKYEWDCR